MTIERKEDNLNPDFSKISYAEYSWLVWLSSRDTGQ
jgi:hypothetical protein